MSDLDVVARVRDAFENGVPGALDVAGWRQLKADVLALIARVEAAERLVAIEPHHLVVEGLTQKLVAAEARVEAAEAVCAAAAEWREDNRGHDADRDPECVACALCAAIDAYRERRAR